MHHLQAVEHSAWTLGLWPLIDVINGNLDK